MGEQGGAKRRPPARLLDLSRLFSRIGRGAMTGVDRVEHAYLDRLLNATVPLFSVLTTGGRTVLLDEAGTRRLADLLDGKIALPGRSLKERFWLRASPETQAARTALGRMAIGQARNPRALFKRHLPAGTAYLNVGHSNVTDAMIRALDGIEGVRKSYLVHDTIPLDFPQYQRPGTVESFRERLRRIARNADLVIYNSRQTQTDAERHMHLFGRIPAGLVAHLGVDPLSEAAALPGALPRGRPFFLSLGTIEPRKNHTFLLDLWEHLGTVLPPDEVPTLVIAGARGWNNEAVFKRLDTSPAHVLELNAADDATVSALLRAAHALLFPSLAEGFGLPPVEALSVGTPVITPKLPVYCEILGNNPIYADVGDMYSWAEEILGLIRAERKTAAGAGFEPPSWYSHFNLVLNVT